MNILLEITHWIIISVLVIASFTPRGVKAQSAEETWAEPVNLSHSGSATNPSILIDSTGTVHAVWQDKFENFVYARLDDNQWSAPQPTNLHTLFGSIAPDENSRRSEESVFTSTNPLFIAGPTEFISAVWINQQGELYASRVPSRSFKDVDAWYGAQPLSSSATAFAAAVDMDGRLHVTYIKAEDDSSNPAGIYYRHSGRNGDDWTDPTLLYESPYFRLLDNSQANIRLITAGTAEAHLVFAVWDNPSRKQVFLARSWDGGANWEQAIQVAGPLPDSGLDGPFGIRFGAKENNIVLVWQSGQSEGTCSQYYQSSNDGGSTWSEAHLMFDNLPGCALMNEFVTIPANNPEGKLLLLTDIRDQIYLSAWDGAQWSVPQAQQILSGFEDPEIFTQVGYDCLKAALSGEQLYIIGCDSGGGGDIWVTSGSMESTASWFSPPIWSQPAPVTSDSLAVEAVQMVATGDNLIHAFFSQRGDPSIYYTRWDGTAWSRIAPVLTLPDGEAGQLAIAAGPEDELFLIVRSSTGSLYYSRANSTEAITPSSWSSPVHLAMAQDGKISPADVAWDAGGTVYIAYSVPVNDERGVYLIQSKDRGETWSEPLQVFDGAAANFEVVGSPSLQVSGKGLLYIMWNQESIPTDGISQPISLYFARSEDGGYSFSQAERIVEAPVEWRKFLTDSEGNLHRLWQRLDMMKTMSDQVSFDNGHSWQTPELFPTEGGIAAVTADTVGGLHLVGGGQGTINYWLWDGSRWLAEPSTRWSPAAQDGGTVEMLAASANMNGNLVVLLVVPTSSGDATEKRIFYITHTVYQPPADSTTQETPAQSLPSPTAASATSPTGNLLMASTTANIQSPSPLSPAKNLGPVENINNKLTPLIAQVLLPLLLLLIGFLIVIYLRAVWSRYR